MKNATDMHNTYYQKAAKGRIKPQNTGVVLGFWLTAEP